MPADCDALRPSDYLASSLLTRAGFRHAFFTRGGGVSKNEYASLNFSVAVGDDPGHVAENLRRAARLLQVAEGRIYFASQVHGAAAELADPAVGFDTFVCRQADVVFGRSPDVACGVRTADCVPILLAAQRSGYVAAVHAGWRGVVRGAVQAGLLALERASGEAEDVIAAIGPHISVAEFEVSDDVASELVAASPDSNVVDRSRARPHVDLRRIVRAQLESFGVRRDAIDDVLGCTYQDSARFYSFRRDGKKSGRHLSAIVAR